ncbi:uncharacterized protein PFL1_06395 [Pseudozyma flocculosa PF-1]|uniref:BSD domain-containing protein n=2 Tax=Pseudozyma flocculosa TaxID=84751 RepID=A0A5C3EVI9_9BASI|nr:uncharacterized protein PFL1_06395 [Pseudozyma flocculosa PF-1]EPQ25940.1 hypothetical protein PFL1_06395 [Pseudozyma flocculosa PF-1]SPO35765.1 uncharacterized protein PSFLO_01236 [Pseudozyma flocculosa]
MDIYDKALTQQTTQLQHSDDQDRSHDDDHADDAAASVAASASAPATQQAQQEISNLVTGISSWWSGVTQKAKQHVDSQGGLLNMAKSEYSRLEAQLSDAQAKARNDALAASQPPTSDIDLAAAAAAAAAPSADLATPTSTSSPDAKGKQRQLDDQSQDAGAALFTTTTTTATDDAALAHPLEAATSFFSRITTQLTSDPRVAALQKNILASLPTAQQQEREQGEAAGGRGDDVATAQTTLSSLSRTIQSHLPHLDLKQSQQIASRYLEASESFAKDLGKDMRQLAGELVRIVPPEEDGAEGHRQEVIEESHAAPPPPPQQQPQPAAAQGAKGARESDEDEDGFVWDEEDQVAGDEAKPAGESAASAATTAAAAETPAKDASKAKGASAAATATATPAATTPAKKESGGGGGESDEDSDWE